METSTSTSTSAPEGVKRAPCRKCNAPWGIYFTSDSNSPTENIVHVCTVCKGRDFYSLLRPMSAEDIKRRSECNKDFLKRIEDWNPYQDARLPTARKRWENYTLYQPKQQFFCTPLDKTDFMSELTPEQVLIQERCTHCGRQYAIFASALITPPWQPPPKD
jgi:hypothetical protein